MPFTKKIIMFFPLSNTYISKDFFKFEMSSFMFTYKSDEDVMVGIPRFDLRKFQFLFMY